ncbi:hypothetical protein TcasGA2_TC033140 [Tribolium castaneum]|uniref:Uncharacterized protein n=1 Tax=Tribolium castaneum TaxID=7070 RepID=A0A139WGU0_TRICA|nr:PREDICTED: uncharacterized protein LOC103313066 [Tribolium castaneum]KYB27208.1 hypothetical protein TcasGA2_TC033140 [Tribolium castaneum]|eukprot:XP_008193585.1 PREDICTED: uncharacterized protein LOC103313066 [Tribolium castaneum]
MHTCDEKTKLKTHGHNTIRRLITIMVCVTQRRTIPDKAVEKFGGKSGFWKLGKFRVKLHFWKIARLEARFDIGMWQLVGQRIIGAIIRTPNGPRPPPRHHHCHIMSCS